MNAIPVLLDTDILSAVIRQDPRVLPVAEGFRLSHKQFAFSLITRFEILRGLMAKGATKQAANFDRFCARCIVVPLAEAEIVHAATIYADMKRIGAPIDDADLLIAATALTNGMTLATNNVTHFNRVPGLRLVNWLA